MADTEQNKPDNNAVTLEPAEQKQAADASKPAAKKKTTHHKTQRGSNTGFIFITFLIALSAVGGLYYLWEQLQKNAISQQLTLGQLEQKLSLVTQQQKQDSEQLAHNLAEVTSAQEALRTNLTKLVRDNEHLRNDWLMAEAEYLIKLASHRIVLEKDVETAQVALKAADARLAEVGDPALLSIRQTLANDIQALANVPRVDIAGISVTLSALSNNISNLPLRTPDPASKKKQQQQEQTGQHSVDSWKDLPAAMWQDLKGLVVIRDHAKPIEPLLSPEQHFFLTQNLELLIEQSRLALLNGHSTVFQERLAAAKRWIKLFFDEEHNVTRNMLSTIETLEAINIAPHLPDISETYAAIQKYRLRGKTDDNSKPTSTVKEKS